MRFYRYPPNGRTAGPNATMFTGEPAERNEKRDVIHARPDSELTPKFGIVSERLGGRKMTGTGQVIIKIDL